MRWTVSHHRVGEGFRRDREDHLDWFFERAEGVTSNPLITFASGLAAPAWCSETEITFVRASRLADHRPTYLDYRGEVSGNRGQITPILRGQFRWSLAETDEEAYVGVELVAVEILDRYLAEILELAELWKVMLRADRTPKLRFQPGRL